MLPLSTLKRTDAQSVLLNWTQSKVKQTDKQMSVEGGQATNSLPIMEHRKQNFSAKDSLKFVSFLLVLAEIWLIWVFHVKQFENFSR